MRQFWHAIPAALAIALSSLLLPDAVDAKAIWSSQPASGSRLMREGFAVGNGRLGGMDTFLALTERLLILGIAIPFGQPGQEKINLNIDSLWSGGPFESSVRATIFSPKSILSSDETIFAIDRNIFLLRNRAYFLI
jgi:hypothetical protein